MPQPSYKVLSQSESRGEAEVGRVSLSETSDELTSSSQDSLDLVLLEIGSKKRKVRRKKRRRMGGIHNFDGAESYEELVGSAKKRRQFLILGGLCAVAVLVILAIVLSVVLINKKDDDPDTNPDNKEELELDDILLGKLQPRRFNGTWIDDTSFHYFDTAGNLVLYDVTLNRSEILVASKDNERFFSASTYEFSADKKFILTASHIIKLFRHSFYALWDVYDVDNKQLIPVQIGGVASAYRLVKFSPVDNSMIVVYENNIYYKRSPTDAEIQITTDGSQEGLRYISNGVPDWVNEEEVFASNSATWFSPDGKKIAYIKFDDSDVPLMSLPIYGGAGDPAFQYPQTLPVNYPKVAAKNPVVTLFYVDLSSITSADSVVRHEIAVPARFVNVHVDHLIASVSWATNNDLIAVFMNRVQSQGEIQKCTTTSGQAVCVNAQTLDVDGGWVEFFTAPFFNKEGNLMTYIGSVSGYRHVVSLDLNTFAIAPRTSGDFVVTEILGLNQEHDVILFTANTVEDSKAQHIYAVRNAEGAAKFCLTCSPTSAYSYFSAESSKGGNNLVVTSVGPAVPQVHLHALDVKENITLTNSVELQGNSDLMERLEGKKLPKIVYDKIVLDNGSESQVMMALPADFDENQKYPMLVEVYGGPDSASVTNKWSIDWGSYLVSSRNIIYAKIDGRGSGLRGDKNLFALYRKLGTVEVHDQIETTEKLQKKHSYIDAARSAIWGWSYGGYVSVMSLTNDESNVFKCAVSVAPVTDWTLYDSIYTERYMGLPTPDDNAAAYATARVMNYVDNIPKFNKTYMLVHGTLDDNVHFQQGMLLARALERKDIQFKEITYPDEDHSLAGVRPHLYHSLERFFDGCFA